MAFLSERAMADLAAEDTEEEEQYEAGDDGEDEGGTWSGTGDWVCLNLDFLGANNDYG